jgi:hypothetical protein
MKVHSDPKLAKAVATPLRTMGAPGNGGASLFGKESAFERVSKVLGALTWETR